MDSSRVARSSTHAAAPTQQKIKRKRKKIRDEVNNWNCIKIQGQTKIFWSSCTFLPQVCQRQVTTKSSADAEIARHMRAVIMPSKCKTTHFPYFDCRIKRCGSASACRYSEDTDLFRHVPQWFLKDQFRTAHDWTYGERGARGSGSGPPAEVQRAQPPVGVRGKARWSRTNRTNCRLQLPFLCRTTH